MICLITRLFVDLECVLKTPSHLPVSLSLSLSLSLSFFFQVRNIKWQNSNKCEILLLTDWLTVWLTDCLTDCPFVSVPEVNVELILGSRQRGGGGGGGGGARRRKWSEGYNRSVWTSRKGERKGNRQYLLTTAKRVESDGGGEGDRNEGKEEEKGGGERRGRKEEGKGGGKKNPPK